MIERNAAAAWTKSTDSSIASVAYVNVAKSQSTVGSKEESCSETANASRTGMRKETAQRAMLPY